MKLLKFNLKLKRVSPVLASLAISLVSGSVLAQAAGLKIGETLLTPELAVEYFSDRNVFRESVDVNNSTGVLVNPRVTWLADYATSEVRLDYEGSISRSGIELADSDDHSLLLFGATSISKRSRANASLEIERETQRRGTGFTIGAGDNNISSFVSNLIQFDAEHTYGARGAKGNLTGGLRIRNFSFSGDNDLAKQSGNSEISPFLKFSMRLAGSTRLFSELRYRNLDFDVDDNDRVETDIFLGIDWEDSERFGATVKIGALDYSFENSGIQDGTDLGLTVGGYFSPVSYSKFEFAIDRSLYDINDVFTDSSTASVRDLAELTWKHEWSSRLTHTAELSLDRIERECSKSDQLTLDTSFEMLLEVTRWVHVGGKLALETRDFEGCDGVAVTGDLNYNREYYGLILLLSL